MLPPPSSLSLLPPCRLHLPEAIKLLPETEEDRAEATLALHAAKGAKVERHHSTARKAILTQDIFSTTAKAPAAAAATAGLGSRLGGLSGRGGSGGSGGTRAGPGPGSAALAVAAAGAGRGPVVVVRPGGAAGSGQPHGAAGQGKKHVGFVLPASSKQAGGLGMGGGSLGASSRPGLPAQGGLFAAGGPGSAAARGPAAAAAAPKRSLQDRIEDLAKRRRMVKSGASLSLLD